MKGLNGNLGLLLTFLNSSYVLKIFPVEFCPHLEFHKFPLNLFLSVKAVANAEVAKRHPVCQKVTVISKSWPLASSTSDKAPSSFCGCC